MPAPAPYYSDIAPGPKGAGHFVTAADGVKIRVVTWAKDQADATVVIFPGRTEYCEKYSRIAQALQDRGYAVAAVDWRGQGLADRLIDDVDAGHVDRFSDYQLDADAYLAHLRDLGMPGPYHLLGHSMGGCIGLRRLFGRHPFEKAAFSAPMWGIALPGPARPVAQFLAWAGDKMGLQASYAPGNNGKNQITDGTFKNNKLTTDPESWAWMDAQIRAHRDLSIGGPTLGWLRAAFVEMADLRAMASPPTPAITVMGLNERIVCPRAIRDRMTHWRNGHLVEMPDLEHETLIEDPPLRDGILDQIDAHFRA